MTTVPGGTGGTPTSSVMLPPLLRICASATVNGNIFNPLVVLLSTVAWKEKMLSPAISSPFVALSKNGCAANPPMDVRSHRHGDSRLVGFAPGVTVTVSSVVPPGMTLAGSAAPTPVGSVGPALLVTLMSSMPIHSSLPTASVVMMRT